jgi:16S rRNA (uracil1498-N3)-methyltransferase
MKLHRFIGDFDLKVGKLRLDSEEFFNQFRNVLKLRVGERVVLCDGNMNEAEAEIAGYGKGTIELEVGESSINKSEPDREVILYCAVLKKENFELVAQKAIEAGVKDIVPIITSRTIKLNLRKDRLEKIAREAAEQSGRGIIPALHDPINLEEAISNVSKEDSNLLLDSSGESSDDLKLLLPSGKIGIWIGPEGGWTGEELDSAGKSGFKIVSLGKLTLRAETAAIVSTYLAVHRF